MRSRLGYPLALGLIIAAAAAVRFSDLSADAPLDGARDMSLSTDGAWYAGAALERAWGGADSRGGPYDRPIYTVLVSLGAKLLGPGIPAAGAVSAVSGLAAILLVAGAARRLWGPAGGLLAAGLLAADYAFLVYTRAPNIYATCALAVSAILWCLAETDGRAPARWRIAIAWGIVLSGGVLLKPFLFLFIPVLLWSLPLPSGVRPFLRRTWPVLAPAGAAAAAGAALWAWKTGWLYAQFHKLREYLLLGPGAAEEGEQSIVYSLFTLELRAGLWAMSAPLLGLAVLRLLSPVEPRTACEKSAGRAFLLTGLALAPLCYSPLRYFIPLYPALALLAAGGAIQLYSWARGEHHQGSASPVGAPGVIRPARWPRAGLGAYVGLQGILALVGRPAPLALALLAPASLGVAALAATRGAGLVRAAGTRPIVWAAGALIVIGLIHGVWRGGTALAAPRFSLQNEGREVSAMLPSCAYLTGPFAHALTFETQLRRKYIPRLLYGEGRLRKLLEGEGFTHLAVDVPRDPAPLLAAFEADGAALEPVWELTVRGARVGLYRLPWADRLCPRGDFESGVAALRTGDSAGAEAHLRRALADHPRSAAAACALGALLLKDGKEREAVELLEQALAWNPDELRAARALVGIRLRRQELDQARALLLHIARADPRDEEAARLADEIASRAPLRESGSR